MIADAISFPLINSIEKKDPKTQVCRCVSVRLAEQSGSDDELVGTLFDRFQLAQNVDLLVFEIKRIDNPDVSYVDECKTFTSGIFQLKGEVPLKPEVAGLEN